jgi:hypothetical protein
MKKLFTGLFAMVAVGIVGVGCAAQAGDSNDEVVGEVASALDACPLRENTAGACSSSLPVTDPLNLGVATLTWEQNVVFTRGVYSSSSETIIARDSAGGIVAQVVRTFSSSGVGDVSVSAGAASGSALWDTTGAILRDTVNGNTTLEATNQWLSDAPPPPTELKESCNWNGSNCVCQCETDWFGDHVLCAANKFAAGWAGDCTYQGWWYCQNGGGGAKCGPKP